MRNIWNGNKWNFHLSWAQLNYVWNVQEKMTQTLQPSTPHEQFAWIIGVFGLIVAILPAVLMNAWIGVKEIELQGCNLRRVFMSLHSTFKGIKLLDLGRSQGLFIRKIYLKGDFVYPIWAQWHIPQEKYRWVLGKFGENWKLKIKLTDEFWTKYSGKVLK